MVSPELQMTTSDHERGPELDLESAAQWALILGRFVANCKPTKENL